MLKSPRPLQWFPFVILFFALSVINCDRKSQDKILEFDNIMKIKPSETNIPRDLLSRPESISASDSTIVLLDYFGDRLFSAFDIESGNMISRFGTVGQGPEEILLGTEGELRDSVYIVSNYRPFMTGKYTVNEGDSSFISVKMENPDRLAVSHMTELSDSVWFMMGMYADTYKYALYRQGKGVTDSIGVSTFKGDNTLNQYHLFLAEQGRIAVSPDRNRIAATTNYSDNIDFIRQSDGSIDFIKRNIRRDPQLIPEQLGGGFRMVPVDDAPIGFLDVAANDKFVFALYAPQSFAEGGYHSPYILVYDWKGFPKSAVNTGEKICGIAANSSDLFLISMEDDDGYSIKKLVISDLFND